MEIDTTIPITWIIGGCIAVFGFVLTHGIAVYNFYRDTKRVTKVHEKEITLLKAGLEGNKEKDAERENELTRRMDQFENSLKEIGIQIEQQTKELTKALRPIVKTLKAVTSKVGIVDTLED